MFVLYLGKASKCYVVLKILLTHIDTWYFNAFSSMASKPINIRWIRTGYQPYWKSCIASYYWHFFHEYKNKNKNDTSFVRLSFWPLGTNKAGFILVIFYFNVCGKLSEYDAINDYSIFRLRTQTFNKQLGKCLLIFPSIASREFFTNPPLK